MLKCRFWFSRSEVGPENSAFLISFQVMEMLEDCWPHFEYSKVVNHKRWGTESMEMKNECRVGSYPSSSMYHTVLELLLMIHLPLYATKLNSLRVNHDHFCLRRLYTILSKPRNIWEKRGRVVLVFRSRH